MSRVEFGQRMSRTNPRENRLFGGKSACRRGFGSNSIDRRENQDKNGESREFKRSCAV
jgi:hypothetical protein